MSSEVASGQVAIFPVFKGFRRTVVKEVEGTEQEASRGFQRGFARTGDASGRAAGLGFRRAFSSQTQTVSSELLKRMTRDVASASAEVSRARLKEQDAAGKVRVAEAQLAEARSRYAADSSQVVRAEERLASAQRALSAAQDTTKASSDKLAAAKLKVAEASGKAASASQSAGARISGAFRGLGPVVSGVASGIGSVFGTVMSGVARAAKAAAEVVTKVFKVAGAAVLATLGGALIGGFGRLSAIEQAEAKLRGLGHTSENVATIMANALAAVKGTAYGLDEAATIAASAVAAGVKPGQDLEKYLRLTADAASIAGVPLSEMGSILNKVTTNQKAYSEELNQLADRGIPIYQWLASAYGVSAEELSDMVSEGKVDAETYRRVIEENIGGAALSAGDTVKGAFANMGAAMNRFGATILKPLFPLFRDLFGVIGNGFDAAAKVIAPFTDAVSGRIGGIVQPILDRLGAFFRGVADGSIKLDFTAMFPGLAILYSILRPIVDELLPIFRDQLLPAFAEAGRIIAAGVGEAMRDLQPILPDVASAFGEIVLALVPMIPKLAELLPPLLLLLPPLLQLVSELLPPLVQLLGVLLPPAVDTVKGALDLLRPFLQFVADGFKGAFEALQIFNDFMTGKFSMREAADQLLKIPGPFGDIQRAARDTIEGMRSFYKDIVGIFSGAASWLINAGRDIVNGLINGIRSRIDAAVSTIRNLGSDMLNSVMGFFGINSPSRVMAEKVGAPIVEGTIVGIDKEAPALARRMQSLVDLPSLGRFSSSVATAGSAVPLNVYVQNPFTGEYLLARIDGRVSTVLDGQIGAGPVRSVLGVG